MRSRVYATEAAVLSRLVHAVCGKMGGGHCCWAPAAVALLVLGAGAPDLLA